MKNELVVILPAYNEEQNVEKMVTTWLRGERKIKERHALNLHIVIVNDGSSDATKEIATRLAGQFSNVTLINHEKNKGLGAAVKTGLSYAAERETCAFACLMDCDNTQDPKYVLSMLRKIGRQTTQATAEELQADVVIASRYQRGASVQGVAGYRLLTSQGARLVYSVLLGVKGVRDYTCGYRLYTSEILKKGFSKYGEDLVSETGFTCMAEVLYKLSLCGARFLEVPFELRYDFKEGNSKMKVVKTAIDSVRLALRLRAGGRSNGKDHQ